MLLAILVWFCHLSWVRWCVLVAVVGLVTGGCSRGDGALPVVPVSVEVTSSTVDVTSSTSSVVSSTTVAPTSTAVSTSISIRTPTTLLPWSVEIDDTTKQQLVETVRGMFQAIADEAVAPSTDHSRIARYAVSPVLDSTSRLVEDLAAKQSHGLPARPIVTLIKVVEVGATNATIQTCSFDDQKVVDNASGRFVNEAVSHREAEVGLLRADGGWRVTTLVWQSGKESSLCVSLEG